MSREITLTQGYVAIVDDEDYESLMQWKWCAARQGKFVKAVRKLPVKGGQQTSYMHRQIMCPPDGMVVDHINHDTLDNRRENLRVCTQSQNLANARKRSGLSSQFKGVLWHKRDRVWIAKIGHDYQQEELGRFHDERDAARAYNVAALELFGEFALLNEV